MDARWSSDENYTSGEGEESSSQTSTSSSAVTRYLQWGETESSGSSAALDSSLTSAVSSLSSGSIVYSESDTLAYSQNVFLSSFIMLQVALAGSGDENAQNVLTAMGQEGGILDSLVQTSGTQAVLNAISTLYPSTSEDGTSMDAAIWTQFAMVIAQNSETQAAFVALAG